jgi:hypothetical protein
MTLLIAEYQQHRESKLASMLKPENDDDSDGWEYSGEEDDYFGNDELDDTTDPEMMKDPIYILDAKVICDFTY